MTSKTTKLPLSNNIDGNLELGYSVKKKRFSVNDDPNVVIEIDPSDIGVTTRLSSAIKEFEKLNAEWEELSNTIEDIKTLEDEDTVDESAYEDYSKKLNAMEKKIKDLIDYSFDSKVADILLGNSSAFSPVNGYFKYEHIITALIACYEQNIKDEAPKFNKRKVQKYTNKYTKK